MLYNIEEVCVSTAVSLRRTHFFWFSPSFALFALPIVLDQTYLTGFGSSGSTDSLRPGSLAPFYPDDLIQFSSFSWTCFPLPVNLDPMVYFLSLLFFSILFLCFSLCESLHTQNLYRLWISTHTESRHSSMRQPFEPLEPSSRWAILIV